MNAVLTDRELETLTAVVDCLIPEDHLGPSASQAGVVEFIHAELSGDYGAGQGKFLGDDGAFLAPLAQYRAGLAALDARACMMAGSCFQKLTPEDRVRLLQEMEQDASVRSAARDFFNQMLENTMEGYFSDPVHGGNRSAAGWKLVGFPGCGHDYRAQVGRNVDVASLVPIQSIRTEGGGTGA